MKTRTVFLALMTYSISLFCQSIPGLDNQWIDPPVLTDPDQEYTILFSALDSGIDSIELYSDNFDFMVSGQIQNSVVFYDNGILSDRVADDNIFTSPYIQVEDLDVKYKPGSETISFERILIYKGGIPTEHNSTSALYLRHHKPDILPEVYQINDQIQYTSYVFNASDLLFTKEMSTRYYQHFEDDKHFIADCRTFTRAGSTARSSLFTVRETTIGIDTKNELVDYSDGYGSESTLESVIQLHGSSDADVQSFNHELAHRWCGMLPDTFRLNNAGSHWNGSFALVGDAFNGSGIEVFENNGDSTYTAIRGSVSGGTYSTLDMYLAGYIGIDDIPWPIMTIQDVTGINFLDGNVVYTSASPLKPITKEWYLAEMPLRAPSVEDSRKEQGVVFFVHSNGLLSPEEISYWHTVALELERTDGQSIYSPYTHHELTEGLGSINTRLTPKNTISTNSIDQPTTKVYPNPTSDYLYVDFEGRSMASFSVYTVNMTTVVPKTSLQAGEKISLGNLDAGLYILQLQMEDGRNHYEQIVLIK